MRINSAHRVFLSYFVFFCRELSRNSLRSLIENRYNLWYSLFIQTTVSDAIRRCIPSTLKGENYLETLSILIADSSEEFRSTLTNALQGNYRIYCCRTGKEALDFLKRNLPDILIMDLMLPELDGLSLLQSLVSSGIHPTTLATTRLANDYVVEATTKLGVEYLMIKPCDIRAIVSRVKDLSCKRPRPTLSAPDNRTHVSNLLVSLGVSTKLRGYAYLREAVLSIADTPMQSITKELYPSIARRFGCNSAQVERSIRNAIQSAWSQRSDSTWSQIFQPDGDGNIARPSNAVFISSLADRITLDQMQFPLSK